MHDASSLGVIAEFDIPSLVPIDGSATFAELSEATGLDEDRLSAYLPPHGTTASILTGRALLTPKIHPS